MKPITPVRSETVGGQSLVVVTEEDYVLLTSAYDVVAMGVMDPPRDFRHAIERVINSFKKENGSNTPDFILAEFLEAQLNAFDTAVAERDRWYLGRQMSIGQDNGR